MKNIRFYEEFKDSRKRNSYGTVVAIMVDTIRHEYIDAIATTIDIPNSSCCLTLIGIGYLKSRCKRISEQQAKKIHPNLFVTLKDKYAK